jgi:hypothetical protein
LATLDLLILLPQAKFDPDPHHDGVMFAAAVAVSEGKVPNRDVFAQYGPLAPLLQGKILEIFGVHLLVLRISTALLLTMTALLVFGLLRNRVGFKIAFLIQLLWVISYPKLPLPPLMPWASVICTLLLLLSWATWKSSYALNLQPNKKRVLYFASGLAFSLAIFVRIQILLFVSIIVIFLAFKLVKRDTKYRNSVFFIYGSCVVVFSFIYWMFMKESLGDFFEQCISWPREFYGQTYLPTTIFTKDGFIYWSTWYYYPFFFFLLLMLFRHANDSWLENLALSRFKTYGIWAVLTFATVSVSFFSFFDVEEKSYLNPILQLQWLIEKVHLGFFYFLATLGFIKVASSFFRSKRTLGFFEIVITAAAIAQLYPGSDPIHLWWIIPILLVVVLPEFLGIRQTSINYRGAVQLLLIFSIMVSSLNLVNLYSKHRVSFSPDSVLSGMQAPPSEAKFIGESLELLEQYSLTEKIAFDCADGLYATSGGGYLPKSKYFVNWGPVHATKLGQGSVVFVCRMSYEDMRRKYPSDEFRILHTVSTSSGRENYILKPE